MKQSLAALIKLAETYELLALARRNIDKAHFNKLKSLHERFEWLKQNGFEQLGQGSSRAAFLVNQRKVLKLALNKAGLAQNRIEFEKLSGVNSPYHPKVFDKAPDDSWIEVELVKPFKNIEELAAYFNIGVSDLDRLISVAKTVPEGGTIKVKLESNIKDMEEGPPISGFKTYLETYKKLLHNPKLLDVAQHIMNIDLVIDDFANYEHFGLAGDGRLVITDAGFTPEVSSNFYRPTGGATEDFPTWEKDVDWITPERASKDRPMRPFFYGFKPEIKDEFGNVMSPRPHKSRDPKNIL